MEEMLSAQLIKLGAVGVLGYVIYWLLTVGKKTLDNQADSQKELAKSITGLQTVIQLQTTTLERIENKLEKVHDDVQNIKHEIGGNYNAKCQH